MPNTPRQRLVAVEANLRSKLSAQRGRSHNTLAQVNNHFNYSDNFVLSQHDYSYNGVGQRKSAQDKLGIYAPPAMNEAYAYDPLGNRTSKGDTGGQIYYAYDANGNLTQKCEGGAITQTQTSCTGASVTTLSYDALNQLTGVDKDGQLSQYAYDDGGRRIRKTVNGTATNYLYNGPDIQAEYRNWSQANISYTHGTGINGSGTDDPLIRVTAANDTGYFHQDGLGSVVATTDQTGNLTAAQLYDAWGKPQQGASLGNLGRYGYTGREPDETGMMYYRARYYDPGIGRFTQRDPAGMPDGVNRYAYVANDPVNAVDPGGEVLNFVIGGGANVLVGGAIRMATGGSFWDAKGIAIDAGVGAATSGVGALVQARNVYRAANALSAEGRLIGTAQNTARPIDTLATKASGAAHEYRSAYEAVSAAKADAGATVYMNRAYSTASGGATKALQRPDVLVKSGSGELSAIEVASKTDRVSALAARNQAAMSSLPEAMQGSVGVIETMSVFGTKFATLPATELGYVAGSLGTLVGAEVGINSYFSNLSGSGGAGTQTMSGVSPRP